MQPNSIRSEIDVQLIALRIMFVSLLLVLVVLLIHRHSVDATIPQLRTPMTAPSSAAGGYDEFGKTSPPKQHSFSAALSVAKCPCIHVESRQ
jgi:hypothetical protein